MAMAEVKLKRLFSPARIGQMEVKNRICVSGHCVNYGTLDGEITQRYIDYSTARAKGGAGLICLEASYVDPVRGRDFVCQLAVHNDRFIPMMRKMAESVHEYGTKIGMQIFHPGRQGDTQWTGHPVEAPSPIPCPVMQNPPEQMSRERIKEVIQMFADAALRVKMAGMDFVEVHAGHGYLPAQFLSPRSNQRDDEYGGSLENRLRFTIEMLQAIRQAVGPDFPVGFRISGDEFAPEGLSLEDNKLAAIEFEKHGLDFISVSAACYSFPGAKFFCPPMELPLGVLEYLAAGIKEVVKMPVMAVGRIHDPVLAEQVLERGSSDFIIMTRALLADPDLPTKAREGRIDDIRRCIACNQGCLERNFDAVDITCTVNPEAGREREYVIKMADRRKRIVVIGGGPAGLECARVAKTRGPEVILCDKNEKLGGMNRFAQMPPGRDDMGEVTRWLEREVRKIGVEVHLGEEATPESVKALRPDAVVVATGSRFRISAIPGVLKPSGELADHVLTVGDVFEGRRPIGNKVVVLGANTIGLHAALHLQVNQGKDVLVVEKEKQPVQDMYGILGWWAILLPYIQEVGLNIKTFQFTKAITPTEVILDRTAMFFPERRHEGPVAGVDEERVPADTVVLAMGREPDNRLFEALLGQVPEIYLIGDAAEPRVTFRATGDGARVGRLL